MEIELLEKDKDSIKIMIKDADMTLISPLVRELVGDKEVDEVKYTAGSQNLNHPTLYVRVKSGKPQTALKRASKALSNDVKTAKDMVEKELK
ncbi:MAG TPA: RpoL/Rpb11 RNA polymerase subunit family protein [Methanomassiliicoccales archaeon]|nr:RpoL/Rpb11 RNA polymerase subunit family protein [Methanomassiliicoccales archaeon]